ncbi:Uncharacterised protein [Vibrio cholerae]|uniref:Uncharacterized protein n=1 Tax=Vibrio cholerae TaxID=666 RepID=A0A655X4R1_VIBCL|nr:hypothetical protein [Vibrio cholerae]CSC04916.1 Uncharacterised protein [Vibrio cholerae]CSE24599.1 Uncharacterised protein [Vibrio cholerae]
MSLSVLKSKILIIFILLATAYVFKPFFNGLGCNFVHTFESERFIQKDYCKYGVMTVITKDKSTGQSNVMKMLWGFWDGYSFEYLLSSNISSTDTRTAGDLLLYNVHSLVSGRKAFDSCPKHCYWVYEEPFEAFYKIERRGRIAFFSDNSEKSMVEK